MLSASQTEATLREGLTLEQGRLKVAEPLGSDANPQAIGSEADVQSELDTRGEMLTAIDRIADRIEPNSIDFFGARAFGNRFVFVLDISFSMKARNGERYRRACDELVRSVSQLRPDQSYYVILFSWYTEKMYHRTQHDYVQASGDHVERLRQWIDDVVLSAGTDPRRALSLARQMEPDAVFLLSDGHFNQPISPNSETGWFDSEQQRSQEAVLPGIKTRFRDLPIHSIAFENPFTRDAMHEIARVTGGQFRYVATQSLEPADLSQLVTAMRQISQQDPDQRGSKAASELRLSYARELIASGELAAAEYLLRPLLEIDEPGVDNRILLDQLAAILESELNECRLEDFETAKRILHSELPFRQTREPGIDRIETGEVDP